MSNRVWPVGMLLSVLLTTHAVGQQEVAFAGRKPTFLAAWALPGEVIDASNAAVLRRRVSLGLERVPLAAALRAVARSANLQMSYNAAALPKGRVVSLRAQEITVVSALTEILLDTGL